MHYLCFQKIRVEKEEDLPEIIVEILAKALGIGKEEMVMEMDEIYSIHTNYAKRHNPSK